MADFNVAKAIRSNTVFAKHLRWRDRYQQILSTLGFSAPPTSAPDFAIAVAAWQSKQGLKSDGMLGPKTWTRLRSKLGTSSITAAIPSWLETRPEEEGWHDAVVLTLRNETGFLTLRHKTHNVTPANYKRIADLIEDGHIDLLALNQRNGNYEFRNEEEDRNTIKIPRRSEHGWRASQALIVHEVTHAISDLKGKPQGFVDEEGFAFVVQMMYRLHFKVPNERRSAATRRVYRAAARIAEQHLAKEIAPETNWETLYKAIVVHPNYSATIKLFPRFEFDGIKVP